MLFRSVSQSRYSPPTNISDQEVLKKAFSAKNGKEVEALYNGDTSAYSNDESAADFALCMHLAFWTGKDKEKMRSLWLNSPLGQRKKTQDRAASGLDQIDALVVSHHLQCPLEEGPGCARNGT